MVCTVPGFGKEFNIVSNSLNSLSDREGKHLGWRSLRGLGCHKVGAVKMLIDLRAVHSLHGVDYGYRRRYGLALKDLLTDTINHI